MNEQTATPILAAIHDSLDGLAKKRRRAFMMFLVPAVTLVATLAAIRPGVSGTMDLFTAYVSPLLFLAGSGVALAVGLGVFFAEKPARYLISGLTVGAVAINFLAYGGLQGDWAPDMDHGPVCMVGMWMMGLMALGAIGLISLGLSRVRIRSGSWYASAAILFTMSVSHFTCPANHPGHLWYFHGGGSVIFVLLASLPYFLFRRSH